MDEDTGAYSVIAKVGQDRRPRISGAQVVSGILQVRQ